MTKHVNRTEVIGNLGRNPEVRNTQADAKVVSFTVATDETWKNKNGVKETRTEWHRVVIYNQSLANLAEDHLMKGHLVRIVGKLRTSKWTDQSGVERYTTEIVVGDYNAELTLLHRASESAAA